MMKCEYCSALAVWGAATANGTRDMCQRHYDDLVAARRAEALACLSPTAVTLILESKGY